MHKVKAIVLGLLFLGTLVVVPNAKAQANSYKQTNLGSQAQGLAAFRGADLVNHWGIAPMGVVANTGNGFKVAGTSSEFIFATEDGTISIGNSGTRSAMLVVNNASAGAVYKGLALVTESNGNRMLLAANFNAGVVEAFDSTFAPVSLRGTFRDPAMPAGFAPFGIHVVGDNEVVVTFAQQDASRHDAVRTAGAGFVSLFDFQGNFLHRIASQGTLNAPFGAAMAPANFGHFAGALLIGNFGDGAINAFDMRSATFLGQLKNSNGNVIMNPSLREMTFGTSQTGSARALFLSGSLGNAQNRTFAEVTPDTTTSATFSLSASPASLTVARGSSGTVTLTATAMTGFTGPISSLTCTNLPANTTYSFSKTSLTPSGSTMDSTTLTLQTSRPTGGGYGGVGVAGMILWLPLASMGMFGMVVVDSRRRKNLNRRTLLRWLGYICGIALLFSALLSVSGCGGGGSGGTPVTNGATVTITGTSGTEMESTTFSLTVQ